MKLLVLTFCLIVLRCSTADEPSKDRNFVGDSRIYFQKEASDFGNDLFKHSGSLDIQTKEAYTRNIRETAAKSESNDNRNLIDDTWKYVDKEMSDFDNFLLKRLESLEARTNQEAVETRIIGGKIARESQFPYQALLSYADEPYCAASIIHKRWALTARHCILENETNTAYITVGTIRLDKVGGVDIPVDRFIPHPGYDYKTKKQNKGFEYIVNDIGLIHLKQPIQFTSKVSPISLAPPTFVNLAGRIGVIAGWGQTGNATSSNLLQTAHIRMIDRKICKQYWTFVRDLHLCASIIDRKRVCLGDSGGALVINGLQYGIISTSDENCRWPKPNLYTDVSAFVRWIQAEMDTVGDQLP